MRERRKSSLAYNQINHKNYNFLDCDWLKTNIFSTNSIARLLSDSLLLESLLLDSGGGGGGGRAYNRNFTVFENSFKLHSPKGSPNFERIFKYHLQCKTLTVLVFIRLPILIENTQQSKRILET